jgi:intracellular septation protein
MNQAPEPQTSPQEPSRPPALPKFLLEFGPLVLFFVLNKTQGIVPATGGFLVAALVAFPFAWRLERKLPLMLFLSTLAIGIFGGLTWWLKDDFFIKIKPTVFSLGVAAFLLAGLAKGKLFLVDLFGASLRLTDQGWRQLTVSYSLFFVAIAALNELIWRSFSVDTWVTFKVFGILPLTFVFIVLQLGLMKRHALPDEDPRT